MQIFKGILITIVVLALIFGITFATGFGGVLYKNTVGVADESANRNVFKENKSYQEGMISDLASYKLQLEKEKDAIARKAIIETIVTKYSNFSPDRIENITLQNFLISIQNGGIK
jgi:hypothetical protein